MIGSLATQGRTPRAQGQWARVSGPRNISRGAAPFRTNCVRVGDFAIAQLKAIACEAIAIKGERVCFCAISTIVTVKGCSAAGDREPGHVVVGRVGLTTADAGPLKAVGATPIFVNANPCVDCSAGIDHTGCAIWAGFGGAPTGGQAGTCNCYLPHAGDFSMLAPLCSAAISDGGLN